MEPRARANLLLACGVSAGMLLALGQLVLPAPDLPIGAAARVNARLITHEEWERAIAAVAYGRRTPLTDEDRQRILARLVDEELLVQHGLALGLAEHDRRLRGQLVTDVIAATAAGVPDLDDAALRRYYEANRDRFVTPPRLRVAALRGDGAAFVPAVPDTPLPPAKLREYLGPTLVEAALALAPGESVTGADGTVVHLLAREPPVLAPLDSVRDEVQAAARRAAEEEAVRMLLSDLRSAGDVVARGASP